MPRPRLLLALTVLCVAVVLAGCTSEPAIDEEFPPGNPVLGDEPAGDDPVIGGEGIQSEGRDSTDYLLLAILALCLIVAGTLLVRVERWTARRADGTPDRS